LLCEACGDDVPVLDRDVAVPGPVSRGHAYAGFAGPARRLLIDLKYEGVIRAGVVMGTRMGIAPGAKQMLRAAEVVVPIPLHWGRRWRRGHNQATVLAKALCHTQPHLRLVHGLRRTRRTRAQVGLPRSRRLCNVRGAFVVSTRMRSALIGRSVVLVDDVLTTGATAAAAAAALRADGAGDVSVYVAAWSTPTDRARASAPR
jgi:ComF family protein